MEPLWWQHLLSFITWHLATFTLSHTIISCRRWTQPNGRLNQLHLAVPFILATNILLGWTENSLIPLRPSSVAGGGSETDSGSLGVDKERNDDENNNGRRAIVNQPCCWQASQHAHKPTLCKLNTGLASRSASLIHLHEHQQVGVLSATGEIRCDAQHVDAFPVSVATRGHCSPCLF